MNDIVGKQIAVCLLTYNHVEVIESTIASILDQTIDGYEVIVSDDCSTDGTWERIKELSSKNPQIKAIQTPHNMGMPGNANFAAKHSGRPYIALLHHDDLYRRDLLEKWHAVFARNMSVSFVFNPYDVPNAETHYGKPFEGERIDGPWLLERVLFTRWGCPIRGTAMIRRDYWERLDGMRERFELLADVDMWMRLASISDVGYVGEPIIKPRHFRPEYYPDIYTGKQWHWKRQRLMYEIYLQNHAEHYNLKSLRGQWYWWKFRSRMSLETAKWLSYAVVRRKWDMIDSAPDSATPHDQTWLRMMRSLLIFLRKRHDRTSSNRST